MDGAKELAAIDGVTVLELDVAQPASIAAWADRVKAAASHVDVSACCRAVVPRVKCAAGCLCSALTSTCFKEH